VKADAKSVTIVAVGDVADCSGGRQMDVAALVDRIRPDAVLALGDLAYPNGAIEELVDCYGPSFGRFRSITRAVPGNHEYHTPHAGAYYAYFCGSSGVPFEGYYSFELGGWHVVALNSNCGGDLDVPAEVATEFGGCGPDSPQAQWLKQDLDAHPAACTLAMWHHPRHSSALEGATKEMQALWSILADRGVDLVLNGHAHAYERFPPMRADGTRDDAHGMREIIVGTGGSALSGFGDGPVRSDVRSAASHGALKVELRDGSYRWTFVPIDGDTLRDEGESPCHG
jgi:3',5'-cyclic AMP phosphodiesterase CpdA